MKYKIGTEYVVREFHKKIRFYTGGKLVGRDNCKQCEDNCKGRLIFEGKEPICGYGIKGPVYLPEKEVLRMKLLVAWLLWWKFGNNSKQYFKTLKYIRKQQEKNGMTDDEIFNVFGDAGNPAGSEDVMYNFRSFILDSENENERMNHFKIRIPKSIKGVI